MVLDTEFMESALLMLSQKLTPTFCMEDMLGLSGGAMILILMVDAEGDHCPCSIHHQDQDHCSTREEVLCLDWRIHPCFPLHLPADVDLQAGV